MKIQAKIGENGLEYYITVVPEGEESPTKEQILEYLKSQGVVYGIQEQAIEELVAKKLYGVPVLVAIGKRPVDGEDGQVILIKEQKEEELQAQKGTVDLRELPSRTRQIVKTGQKVAQIIPPTPGVEGYNVFGRVLNPKPGRPAQVKLGKNVKTTEDGMYVEASKDGILVAKPDGTIEVQEILVIKGDVDYATGNIDFPGEVEISGDVKPGFTVKAKGNININGVIEAATVISYEGSINVLGVKGRERGLVKAKGNVQAKFLENAIVESDANVIVTGPITNSQVKAKLEVKALGNKGIIVGGIISAGYLVEAEEIGSPLGVKTVVEVGLDPDLMEKIKILKAKIELDKENLGKLASAFKMLKETIEKTKGEIPAEKIETYRKLGQALINLRDSVEKASQELKMLEIEIYEKYKSAKIVARKILHPGVEAQILQKKFYADKALEKVIIELDNENREIRLGGYSG
ncbi:DUF342 domain-containing protein [Pseudothermotoga thermarum]|uniref:Flagellar Assembly Protein A N-terminal region domain-containing protein n=1 Tax=Pseudothermotoga thermarum DSM 5069 TaxID=688269 RepID=F7YYU7_9THEM|nr:FapA family protein [Pseudothermotoga thermarum]AEH51138.1 protein of unknown function DUF342 [Pseudothermotoga thermarum DSM 5069]